MFTLFAQNVLPKIDITLPANIPGTLPTIVLVAVGIVVLLFGRSLYWAFVAIAGFLIGWELAQQYLHDKDEMIRLLAAVGAGVLGAILGIMIQRLAFAIGGFFAGGYLALVIAARLHAGGDPNIWMIVGGVIGAVVAAMLMDWAIIVLSSLAGAAAILTPFQTKMDGTVLGLAFLGLAIVGIVFQGRGMMGRTVVPPPAATPTV
ncbi:MAG TPA: DUF4203 domain-containing protein [Pirellulales bacterium]|jgi:hypothetical protein